MLASDPKRTGELAGLLRLPDSKVLIAAVRAATEHVSAKLDGVQGQVQKVSFELLGHACGCMGGSAG